MFKLVVLCCLLAVASAGVVSPFIYGASFYSPYYGGNYRGPLSLAPGQPANILAADGRPLDTLDVNLDRSAHYTAKAFSGYHLLKKRSVVAPVISTPYTSHVAYTHAAPLIAPVAPYGIAHVAPVARYTAPYITHW